MKRDFTLVIVAHNIDSTYDTDNIITIDKGKVVDIFERTNVHKDLDNIISHMDNLYYKDHLQDYNSHKT